MMEALPEYNTLYNQMDLPSYCGPIKQFIVKSKPTLNFNMDKLSWNICEKDTGLTWYKLYTRKREITLKDTDKSILMQLMESPSKQPDTKHYNFIINNLEAIEVLMKATKVHDEFFYQIDIINPSLKGNKTTSYGISRKKSTHLSRGIWCLYNLDNPSLNIVKFTQSISQAKVADIVFYQPVPPFEFQIFLLAVSQCIYQIPSLY